MTEEGGEEAIVLPLRDCDDEVVHIRPIRSLDERIQYNLLGVQCFHESTGGYTEPECVNAKKDPYPPLAVPNEQVLCLFRRPDVEDELLVGEEEGEAESTFDCIPKIDSGSMHLVGGLNYLRFGLRVVGFPSTVTVPSAGIAGVVSTPPHRNRGLVRALFSDLFRRLHSEPDENERTCMSSLFPFKYEYYERLGYVAADEIRVVVARPENFVVERRPNRSNGIRMREVFRLEEKAAIAKELFSKWTRNENVGYCAARRPEHLWREYFKKTFFFVVTLKYEVDAPAKRVGYLACRIVTERKQLGHIAADVVRDEQMRGGGALMVREAVWLNREAKEEIIRVIASHRDQVSLVVWATPKWFHLSDYIANVEYRLDRLWSMARVVDFEGILRRMTFRLPEGESLLLDVSDPLCPWNDALFRIFGDSFEKTERSEEIVVGEGCVKVSLSIVQLTIVVVGRRAVEDLDGRFYVPDVHGESGDIAQHLLGILFPTGRGYFDEEF